MKYLILMLFLCGCLPIREDSFIINSVTTCESHCTYTTANSLIRLCAPCEFQIGDTLKVCKK